LASTPGRLEPFALGMIEPVSAESRQTTAQSERSDKQSNFPVRHPLRNSPVTIADSHGMTAKLSYW
jgi:hypothetical protein